MQRAAMLRRALDAFSDMDTLEARRVPRDDDRIDREEEDVIGAVMREIQTDPGTVSEAVDVILIAKHLERVGDHATDIAEDVILAAEARNVKHAAKRAR